MRGFFPWDQMIPKSESVKAMSVSFNHLMSVYVSESSIHDHLLQNNYAVAIKILTCNNYLKLQLSHMHAVST